MVSELLFVYVISPNTRFSAESTTDTEGNFPKLCVIDHVFDATLCVCTYVLSILDVPFVIP